MNTLQNSNDLLSYREAAKFVVLSLRQFRRVYIDTGSLPIVWVSERRPRVRLDDLNAFLKSRTVQFRSPQTQ